MPSLLNDVQEFNSTTTSYFAVFTDRVQGKHIKKQTTRAKKVTYLMNQTAPKKSHTL